MSDTELKPCPFCGKETAPDHIKYDNCFVVRCIYCGYVSAHTASERGAIQNHNSLCRMVKNGGNAAARREALEKIQKLVTSDRPADEVEIANICRAALSAPPKNCEKYETVDEAMDDFADEALIEEWNALKAGKDRDMLTKELYYFINWLFATRKERVMRSKKYEITCEIPHDSGMHEWVVETNGGKQIYIESAHEDAVKGLIDNANYITPLCTPMDEIQERLEHYAKDFRVVDTLCLDILQSELREQIDKEHRLMRNMARWIKTHDIYGHMAKELLDECKEVLNDDGEFLFGKGATDGK